MELNHFDGFFSTFAALNLGYAGFKRFRSAIDSDILKIALPTNSKIKQLQDEINSFEAIKKFGEIKEVMLEKIQSIFNDRIDREKEIQTRSAIASDISEGFKSMFLSTSFFCLVILTIAGFQFTLGDDLLSAFLFSINFILLYNFIVFARSFTRFKNRKIRPVVPLIILLLIIITFAFVKGTILPNSLNRIFIFEVNISISLFTALSPYLFHFLRLLIHRRQFIPKIKKNDKECIKRVTRIKDVILTEFTAS